MSRRVCEMRDLEGNYCNARAGLMVELTGISSPYDAPEDPELVIHTAESLVNECVQPVVDILPERQIVGGNRR